MRVPAVLAVFVAVFGANAVASVHVVPPDPLPAVAQHPCHLLDVTDGVTRRRLLMESIDQFCAIQGVSMGRVMKGTSRYLVSHQLKTVFAINPKVMSSSMKMLVASLENRTLHALNDLSQFTLLAELEPPLRRRVLTDYHRVLFVRDPLARLYSAWHNKFPMMYEACKPPARCGPGLNMWLAHARTVHKYMHLEVPEKTLDVLKNTSWPLFLESALLGWINDRHWTEQVSESGLCAYRPTFVGMQEFADEDVDALLLQLGRDPEKHRLPHRNSAAHVPLDYERIYPDMVRRRVRTYYKDDLLAFGYPSDPTCLMKSSKPKAQAPPKKAGKNNTKNRRQ